MSTLHSDSSRSTEPRLLRALGRPEAMAIVVGNVIGSGIFLKPGGIAEQLESFSLILLVWVVGGLLCLLGALSLSELTAMYPRSGGLYVFLREAYGPLAAFLWGWTDFFIVRPASIGALATAFVLFIPGSGGLPVIVQTLLAVSVIAFMAWVNIRGVVWGGRVQDLTTLVKVGFLLAIALLPFALMRFDIGYLTPVVPEALPTDLSSRFGLALVAVMWAYNGWHSVSIVGEEIVEPQRNLPIALLSGVSILIILYLGVNIAYHVVLPVSEIAAHGENAAYEVARELLGPIGASAIAGVIMISVFGAINCNMLVYPRVYFAMARDGLFFRPLGHVHARYHTPAVAIAAQAVIACTAVALANFGVHHWAAAGFRTVGWLSQAAYERFTAHSVFTLLTGLVIFGASIFYMLAVASVIVLRRSRRDQPRPYRTVGYPWVPLAFVISYVWFIWQIFLNERAGALIGIGLIATGLPAGLIWLARQRRARRAEAQPPSGQES